MGEVQPTCPCCGAPWDKPDPVAFARSFACGPVQQRALVFLAGRFGQFVATTKIADHVYQDRTDGVPISANDSIRTVLWQLRRRMGSQSHFVVEGKTNSGFRLLARSALGKS